MAALKAMLNYGAASQEYFGYKTDALANASLSEADKALAFDNSYLTSLIKIDEAVAAAFASTETITNNGQTLILEGATSIKFYMGVGEDSTKFEAAESAIFYFWTEEDYKAILASGAVLSVENASYTKTAEFAYAGASYGYEFSAASDEFVAKDLGKTLYTALVVVDSEGVTHCSGVIAYSPEAYAEYKLNDGVESGIDTLVKWLVVYGEYAKTYLENK